MQEFVCGIGFGKMQRRTSLDRSGCVSKCFRRDEQTTTSHGSPRNGLSAMSRQWRGGNHQRSQYRRRAVLPGVRW